MKARALYVAACLAASTTTLSAQLTPKLWKAVDGNDIVNLNSGHVGIGTNPSAPLHVRGDILLQQGDFRLRSDLDSIRFPTSSGANSAMIEMFSSGTTNADRMVIAHSPGFADWGLQYRDASDEFHFLRGGNSFLRIDLASEQFAVTGDTSLGNAIVGGNLVLGNDVSFSHDNVTLKFGDTSGSNSPMMEMFDNPGNDHRMVIAHSGGFSNWGLQYRDNTDSFDFLRSGNSVFEVNLGSSALNATANLSFRSDNNSIVFPESSGSNDSMIHMFSGGTSNSDRMVISHSPAFWTWGLQYRDSADEFRFLGAGNSAMTVELGSREVGIRADNPVAALQVGTAGDGSAGLSNAWNVFSSRDYKKNIVELDADACADALDKVVSTPVFQFHYKEQDDADAPRIGLIVEESPEEMLASEVQIDGQTKAVDLARYISMLHAALKGQQAKIDQLQSQQAAIDELRAELAALQSQPR